jgi:hypothetical protein
MEPTDAATQMASSTGGGYLVQVSSQKNEADVQASHRALQNRFPAALGSRPPVINVQLQLYTTSLFRSAVTGNTYCSHGAATFSK